MADAGLGRRTDRRAPRERPDARHFPLLTGVLSQLHRLVGPGDDARDRKAAERGHRIAALVAGQAPPDIWEDIKAILLDKFDETLDGVMDFETAHGGPRVPPEALLPIRDILTAFDKNLILGQAAMQRLAEKRMVHGRAVLAAEHRSEQSGASE